MIARTGRPRAIRGGRFTACSTASQAPAILRGGARPAVEPSETSLQRTSGIGPV